MATTQTATQTRKVIELLGGPGVFPGRIRTARDLRDALRNGLPYAAFEAIVEALELRSDELAELIGAAPRTLARRKSSRQLSPTESDRLYRVAHITLLAAGTLGSLDKARAWLHKPNRALAGESPIGLLDTEIGERQVEDLLNRINYGIYS